MSPEMQALYRYTLSDPKLSVMFRQRATNNAASLIASLFDDDHEEEHPSSRLSDEQIAQLQKPKAFSEIREALRVVLPGRSLTVAELSKMSVFGRIKKGLRCSFIRQNLYKMEADGQVERVGSQSRNITWRLS